ncbi:histone H1 [bacterium]|nr:histone H1 [bacterium]
MQELLDQLQEELNNVQEDATKFAEKGNKAAGTRVRKSMQAIKTLAQDVRVAVSAANNA